jgi:hypothetical protein
MGRLFDALLSCFGSKKAPAAGRKPAAKRFRPAVENLEQREVPALIASQYLGAFGGVIPSRPFISINRVAPVINRVAPVKVSQPTTPPLVGGVKGSVTTPITKDDCLRLFQRLGANATSGAARAHGKGQLKYWVCHHTGSKKNPYVMINVAAPAAFGAHLRHGDIVFIRRTPGAPITTVRLDAKGRLVVDGDDAGPFSGRKGSPNGKLVKVSHSHGASAQHRH